MRIGEYFKIGFLVFIIISAMSISVLSQEEQKQQYKDGIYEASNDMLDVAVTIEAGEILDIEILEHRGGGEAYGQMLEPLIDTVIEEQSTEVDAVTGATVSSNALKQAIEEALEKAKIEEQ